MSSTSTSAQIASAVKATLDGYDLPRINKEPTIITDKNFTIELCRMAATVESDKTGRKCGHMHLILNEKEYRIDTKTIQPQLTYKQSCQTYTQTSKP